MWYLIWLKLWKCTIGKRIAMMVSPPRPTLGSNAPSNASLISRIEKRARWTSTIIQYTRLQQFASRPNTCLTGIVFQSCSSSESMGCCKKPQLTQITYLLTLNSCKPFSANLNFVFWSSSSIGLGGSSIFVICLGSL